MRPQQTQENLRPRISADLENVKILPGSWRNFAGRERLPYNAEGERNFTIAITDPIQAMQMIRDGWRVKQKDPYVRPGEDPDEGAEPEFHLQVKVGYKYAPPRTYLITTTKTPIGEGLIGSLDDLEILTADISISGKWSDMAGGGYTAYLREGYFVIKETRLSSKWADVPMSTGAAEGETYGNSEVDD